MRETYAECSSDIEILLSVTARLRAQSQWRRFGARSESEAYSFFVAATRRRVGIFVLREFVRHRLRRIPYVGVPREQLQAARHRPHTAHRDRSDEASGFYAHQVHAALPALLGA